MDEENINGLGPNAANDTELVPIADPVEPFSPAPAGVDPGLTAGPIEDEQFDDLPLDGEAPSVPPATVVPGYSDFDALPPQYSTAGDAGFFNRQNEAVPTAVTTGPDGAFYVSELSALPYPEGYARVLRIENPEAVPGFDGETPSGVPQIYASGFEQINGLAFDGDSNLFVLEYESGATVYDPTIDPASLPPSRLIKVAPDGVREQISGDELLLANYVEVDKATGDVYVSINNADTDNGQILRYSADSETGDYGFEVVADGLNNPRGLRFGPDGDLYALEQGLGTPADAQGADDAPVIPFIPGLVSERGGYTGSIARIDTENGGFERIYEGLPSFREFNPATGEDRVISIGPNGFDIADDGTVYIASGGGLSVESRAALGDFGEGVSGVLKLTGLFGDDPSSATWEPAFDSVTYAKEFSPDGATTLFNTQSNLNDVVVGPDGKVYTVDAARNTLYGLDDNGESVESATVLQKIPPILTPVQYALVTEAGGDPTADYRVEISERTFKGENELPDTPGRQQAFENAGGQPGLPGEVAGLGGGDATPPRGEDAAIGESLGNAGVPGNFDGADGDGALAGSPGEDQFTTGTGDGFDPTQPPPEGFDPTQPPPDGFDPTDFDPTDPTSLPPGVDAPTPLIPGPVDPTAAVVYPGNPFEAYFDPFFGVYDPAPGTEPMLPDGMGGTYAVDGLYSFGDRLSEDGGEFGKNAVAQSLDANVPYTEGPYSELGNFTDGLNWTDYLSRILGVDEGEGKDTNFAYLDATARPLVNAFDPFQDASPLSDFAAQIDQFKAAYGTFSADDLVTVNFGGNDLTLPPDIPPEDLIGATVGAVVDGLQELADLGAEHLLVTNVVDVGLAPLFSDPAFLEGLGPLGEPGALEGIVAQYNAELETALDTFEAESGVDVKLLDTNKLFGAIADEPDAYGFTNVAEPVLVSLPNPGEEIVYNPAIVGQDPAVEHGTLFVDPLFHPTALGHSILAETARDTLLGLTEGKTGVPGGGPLPTPPVAEGQTVLTFLGEDAAYDNTLGFYFYDLPNDGKVAGGFSVDGEIGEGSIAFASSDAAEVGDEVVIDVPDNVGVAPFLIADGANQGIDLAAFEDGGLTFAGKDGGPATVLDDAPPAVLAGGEAIDTAPFHVFGQFPNGAAPLNPDGLVHALTGNASVYDLQLVAFEDKLGLGDKDFNDAVVSLSSESLKDGSILDGIGDTTGLIG